MGKTVAKKPRLAILAVLSSLDPAYSVAGVVASQLRVLSDYGFEVVFVTTEDFQGSLPESVILRTYPRFQGDYELEKKTSTFETYVTLVAPILKEALSDCSTCLAHDIIFIQDFLPVNWAARKAGEALPGLHWLHWVHSAPSERPRKPEYPLVGCYLGMPNSEIAYVNRVDAARVADMFSIPEATVRLVHNWIDPSDFFDFHPLSREITTQFVFSDADTICIYPTRASNAKQPERAIKLLAYMKKLGQTVRLVFCNSYSNAPEEQKYIGDLQELGASLGLTPNELVFTSQLKSSWCDLEGHNIELGVPRKVIADLMRLSDLFILSSASEACSIIMLEAALSKNMVVLNEDLESLHEFGGQKITANSSPRAIYYSFGSLSRPVLNYSPSEEAWLADHARALIEFQAQDRAIQFFKYVRKRHSPRWILENQLIPLLK